ncbi:hypothetical protein L596_025565 [Steinernema carpocapsae]|uniref:Uncharacterized protein n=1 Tax=Steinernema carpocapsae TaxID=34508 RepID=A0A4U5M848_STECR|nr:hypothetical protein L596_025565 [Steinernema carpocapsae]
MPSRGRPRYGTLDDKDPNKDRPQVIRTRMKARERRESEKRLLAGAKEMQEQITQLRKENEKLKKQMKEMDETYRQKMEFHNVQMSVYRDKDATLIDQNCTLRRQLQNLSIGASSPPSIPLPTHDPDQPSSSTAEISS